ncbi:MAG: bifunctional glutamate N-acetyltransferase/amino-acid acetyltransferase ArgJ [Acidimicrobiia bacterium]
MSVTAPLGFVATGLASGIKPGGLPDLALVVAASRGPVPAAGVFTANRFAAAPVQVSRAHLAGGRATAVILNSGNANAATGGPGLAVAERTCELVAEALGPDATAADVLVCSTGRIGMPLSIGPIASGIPGLVSSLRPGPDGGRAAAEAILTTDTVSKEARASFETSGVTVTVGGMAKGAGMLCPSMATMLAVITTDATVEAEPLYLALAAAVEVSFNTVSIDGCMSTNDTVLVLAGGAAGAAPLAPGSPGWEAFTEALGAVCGSLAEQIVEDAEGATKLIRVVVRGARSDSDARLAARAVANSPLVKCAFFGELPYWGRVASELGASGADVDPGLVEISYDGIVVCSGGVAAAHDAESVGKVLRKRRIELTCDLGRGTDEAVVLTSDLTFGYVDENRTGS